MLFVPGDIIKIKHEDDDIADEEFVFGIDDYPYVALNAVIDDDVKAGSKSYGEVLCPLYPEIANDYEVVGHVKIEQFESEAIAAQLWYEKNNAFEFEDEGMCV